MPPIRWEQSIKSAMGLTLGAFFMLLAGACQPAGEHHCPPFGKTETVTISEVIDGDTVRLADGRKVRLIGVNTTELGRDGEPDQPFAKESRQALQTFLGSRVQLLLDRDDKDNHGRTLAHLYNLNGKSAEAHLLRQGLAWHVAIPPNLAQAECLSKAEKSARSQGIGLWSTEGIPPIPAAGVSKGGFQLITGKVHKIHFGQNGWWLNFGEQVAAVIYPEHQHRFDRKQLEGLKGKTVTIRGWVYPSRSNRHQPWRLKLETPFGIEPGPVDTI